MMCHIMSWHNPALVCTIRLQYMKTSTNKTVHIDETPPEASACSVIYGKCVWRVHPCTVSLVITRHADSTLQSSHPDVHYPPDPRRGQRSAFLCCAPYLVRGGF